MDETIIEPAELPKELRCVRIQSTLAGKVNLADFQNAIPVIRELSVANDTDADIKDVRLTVSSEPSFFKLKSWYIDHVAAGRDARINDLDVALDGLLLSRLTESEKASITFRLTTGFETPAELASFESTVELLPRNQWGGLSSVPDMVAAFVQPNEPSIERVLKKAAEVLRKAGKSGAINGYQEAPRRAWELASAIWSAIGSMGIDYALPSASFEQSGQKVRSPSQIGSGAGARQERYEKLVVSALAVTGESPYGHSRLHQV